MALYNLLMSKSYNVSVQDKIDKVVKTRLPGFSRKFFIDNRDQLTLESLYGYAIDLVAFFDYICDRNHYSIEEMSLKDFEAISEETLEDYMESCRVCDYYKDSRRRSVASLRRRYASLSSFYRFYYMNGLIRDLPIIRVIQPRLVKKRIPVPTTDTNMELIRYIATGTLPSQRASGYQCNIRTRDTALAILMICAGLKASDCKRLNIQDLHLDEGYITVKRSKNSRNIYISDFIATAVSDYLIERLEMIPEYGHDNALFLSLQRKRIAEDTVEKMIHKYTTALFGRDGRLCPKDLSMSFRENVFYETKDANLTAQLTGNAPITVINAYKADVNDLLDQKRKMAGKDFFG
jgi:site-specific recombinase XerD